MVHELLLHVPLKACLRIQSTQLTSLEHIVRKVKGVATMFVEKWKAITAAVWSDYDESRSRSLRIKAAVPIQKTVNRSP
ncbi:hypothetical protein QFC21_006474 [Naganishia friedmannii]|uniref:Uncharacterized protein n=1 Tax=Naganishia friedmannii TaxID=89922 RepID=A0ACC2V1E5_9TREE|nr:hypothetical protein QFC21_006474 [Naganishia friedmannii]